MLLFKSGAAAVLWANLWVDQTEYNKAKIITNFYKKRFIVYFFLQRVIYADEAQPYEVPEAYYLVEQFVM